MKEIWDSILWLINFVADGTWPKIFLGIFIALIIAEQIVIIVKNKPKHKELLPNIVTTLINMVVDVWVGAAFLVIYTLLYNHARLFTAPENAVGYVYAFLVVEFISYLQHWAYHRVGLLWAMHSVHHSAEELNVAVTNRSMWGLTLFIPLLYLIPVLGISIGLFALVNIPRALWAFLLHSDLMPQLGPIDRWFNTPSNHRVHHGRQPKYLDKNYSQGLLLFDRIFRTYQAEEEAPEYGLVKQVGSRNPIKFQIAGLQQLYISMRSADRWSDRLAYLYMPPDWTHGVSTKASNLRDLGIVDKEENILSADQ
jgi:sterol desaturase/sphingolipid hydroxylase (fatty acid hydroxylase superfamily)